MRKKIVKSEMDCLKYLGSQGATDGGFEMDVVQRKNEGYEAWKVLKRVQSNGLGINAKKCLYKEIIVPMSLR